MKIAGFTGINGQKIGIPISKITGFCEDLRDGYNTFIANGTDCDGIQEGWDVKEKFGEVWIMLESMKD